MPSFRLEQYFAAWEFTAKFNLAASDLETRRISDLLAVATDEDREAFNDLALGYTPTWGGDHLREAIASTYATLSADEVLVFAGAEEAIFWAMQVLSGPNDHVIMTVPNYQSMETVPLRTGAQVSGVVLDSAQGWRLDLDEVRRAWRPNTSLVAVNFPNNPTGALPDQQTWRELVDLCVERGVRLFSDEVYRGLEPEPSLTLPQAADMHPAAVSLNVLSKSFGLAGLRIGWVATHDHGLLEELERHKHYTTMCNSGPSEALATIAIKAREEIWASNRQRISSNRPLFDDFFEQHVELFDWSPPQAGCVTFPRYLGRNGVDAMTAELVEQAGVLLLPASLFRSDLAPVPGDRFRIGLGRRGAEEALAAFDGFLRARSTHRIGADRRG
ncbi:aminotransferase class I/II-fold pyridoxal phosphate-dependent enzyme (plasmid) [Nocardioides sp. R1-1]|uniref:aminotransferase class I/II-fold pyridoxal phosphate-dependent enzyme n=1 Tax=Nocardioides sp. R1-1 TaxID=3383502 RepID=UPI0038D1BD4D